MQLNSKPVSILNRVETGLLLSWDENYIETVCIVVRQPQTHKFCTCSDLVSHTGRLTKSAAFII